MAREWDWQYRESRGFPMGRWHRRYMSEAEADARRAAGQIAQNRMQWLPMLERVYALKAERDASWALFGAQQDYLNQLGMEDVRQTGRIQAVKARGVEDRETLQLELKLKGEARVVAGDRFAEVHGAEMASQMGFPTAFRSPEEARLGVSVFNAQRQSRTLAENKENARRLVPHVTRLHPEYADELAAVETMDDIRFIFEMAQARQAQQAEARRLDIAEAVERRRVEGAGAAAWVRAEMGRRGAGVKVVHPSTGELVDWGSLRTTDLKAQVLGAEWDAIERLAPEQRPGLDRGRAAVPGVTESDLQEADTELRRREAAPAGRLTEREATQAEVVVALQKHRDKAATRAYLTGLKLTIPE